VRCVATTLCLLGLALALVPAAPAGELDEFEKDATRDRREESAPSRTKDHDHHSYLDDDLGSLTVDGNDRDSGFSFALPVSVYAHEYIGVEFHPAWASINGTTVRRYELGVYLAHEYVALKGGYRWMQSPNESLDGPFVGISLRY